MTGGYDGSNNIATTEVLHAGAVAWTFVGGLPRAMRAPAGVNLGNRLLMTGTNLIDKVVG